MWLSTIIEFLDDDLIHFVTITGNIWCENILLQIPLDKFFWLHEMQWTHYQIIFNSWLHFVLLNDDMYEFYLQFFWTIITSYTPCVLIGKCFIIVTLQLSLQKIIQIDLIFVVLCCLFHSLQDWTQLSEDRFFFSNFS